MSINSMNLVDFCRKRLNPIEVSTIIQQNPQGLSDLATCETHLSNSNYIPVLSAIWGEKDKEKKLTWLRSHADQLHAPLMLEQAIAEFVNQPTVNTIINISFPLIRAASFRVKQDAACSKDPSLNDGKVAILLELTYEFALEYTVKKHTSKLPWEVIKKENVTQIGDAIQRKLIDIAQKTLSSPHSLPNPKWISHCGLNSSLGHTSQMQSATDYAKKRQEVAKKVLEQLGG